MFSLEAIIFFVLITILHSCRIGWKNIYCERKGNGEGDGKPYPDSEEETDLPYPDNKTGSGLTFPDNGEGANLSYSDNDEGANLSFPDNGEGADLLYPENAEGASLLYTDTGDRAGLNYPDNGDGTSLLYPDNGDRAGIPYRDNSEGACLSHPDNGDTAGLPYPDNGERAGLPYPDNGNTDIKLSQNVQLKYFNKLNKNLGETWNKGGQNISFNGSKINIQDVKTFIPDIETVFIVHGFMSDAPSHCDSFVKNYKMSGMDVQVICIDWRNLAFTLQFNCSFVCRLLTNMNIFKWWDTYNIDAQNSIDVGWWLGRLIHHLVKETELQIKKIHLIGHSLGAHAVGKAGHTFTSLSGKKVARITGLDPAGPNFVQDRDGLKQHRIGKYSGAFVDIIHTNGDFDPYILNIFHIKDSDFMGDLNGLGHADFYPNGGRKQGASGCLPTFGLCSHIRSVDFYLQSILDGPSAFPAYYCTSAKTCSEGKEINHRLVNHMGEFARQPDGEGSKTYYLDVSIYGAILTAIGEMSFFHLFY